MKSVGKNLLVVRRVEGQRDPGSRHLLMALWKTEEPSSTKKAVPVALD
jgi:hypothetical protein